MNTGTLMSYANKLTREELALIPTPDGTKTHRPIPHHEIVQALIETLGFRHIAVITDEYAVSGNGMKLFGVLDLETQFDGCRFSIGLRNAHDRSMRLGLVVGFRVTVCENMMFSGDFQPVLAKHSRNFSLLNAISIGIDQMQRNFEPLRRQVEQWREQQIADPAAKLIIYRAFVEGELEAPSGLMAVVHCNYFQPYYQEFNPRTLWSLSNAFTSAFKQLGPISQFKATAKLGEFFAKVRS